MMADSLDLHHLTLADLARLINGGRLGAVIRSDRHMRGLHSRAGLRVGAPRSISFFRFLAWLGDEVCRKRNSVAPRPASTNGDDDAAYKHWRARLAELEYLQKTGEFVPVEDRDALLAQRALEFRRGLEAALLHRLPPRLATLYDPAAIAEMLEGVIRELMEKYTRPCD